MAIEYPPMEVLLKSLREAGQRHLDKELLEEELMMRNADAARRLAEAAMEKARKDQK